jgi:FixJ family two-component response regulator
MVTATVTRLLRSSAPPKKRLRLIAGHIMKKMGVKSFADLVRAAEKLGIFGRRS